MIGQLLDGEDQYLATVDVELAGGVYEGRVVDFVLGRGILELFSEYEYFVVSQLFSGLGDVERRVEALGVVFVPRSGDRVLLTDLQIYPSTRAVSFRVAR